MKIYIVIILAILGLLTFIGEHNTEKKIKGRDYSGVTFSKCDFANAKIWNSKFDNANLDYCNFRNAYIYDSSLKNVSMKYSDFTGAKIIKSNLKYSDMSYSNFSETVFMKNKMDSINFQYSLFDSTDFTMSSGIDIIGDNAIFVGNIIGENSLNWISREGILDYQLFDDADINPQLILMATQHFISEQSRVINSLKNLSTN